MGFIGLLRTLEQITRPLSHDVDLPVVEDRPCDTGDCWYDAHGHVCPHHCFDGAEQLAEREAETECLVPEDFNAVCRCMACVAEEQASAVEYDDDPSPTIVQSAPPPTVDGEGPSACEHSPAPAEGRPTSELLTRAADVIDISAAFASALGYCNEDTGTQLDVFSAELRDRAATFADIEQDK